jgi:hypothetical protein
LSMLPNRNMFWGGMVCVALCDEDFVGLAIWKGMTLLTHRAKERGESMGGMTIGRSGSIRE